MPTKYSQLHLIAKHIKYHNFYRILRKEVQANNSEIILTKIYRNKYRNALMHKYHVISRRLIDCVSCQLLLTLDM